jgi:hypothetical protein
MFFTRLITLLILTVPSVTAMAATASGKGKISEKRNDPAAVTDERPTDEPNNPLGNKRAVDPALLDDVTLRPVDGGSKWQYAAGLNLAWSIREDYGARTFRRFEPEVVGFMYTELPVDKLFLRHGARVGYSKDQPQMPKALRVEETDWKASIEEGVVYSWYVVPSLTFGLGCDWRRVSVKATPPIKSVDSRLNSKETFMWYYTQVGLGLPAMKGEYMLEPILRWQHLSIDRRTNWALGFEITKAW